MRLKLLLLTLLATFFTFQAQAQKLHFYKYEAGTLGLGGDYKETIIFDKDDPFKFIIKGHIDTPQLGSVQSYPNLIYTDQNNKKQLVSGFLLTVYENIKRLQKHWDTYGGSLYQVSKTNRLEVTIEYMDDADHDTDYNWKGGDAGEAYWSKIYRGLYFTLDAGLDAKKLISTLAHEYFHLVQYSLYPTYRNLSPGDTRLMVVESGAEWASDVSMQIETKYLPANHGLKKNLDALNGYKNRISPWFSNLKRDFDQYDSNSTIQYEATVFFKYLFEWLTDDFAGKDVRKFMKFNDIYYSYWSLGKSGFINAVKDIAGGKKQLEGFLLDFLSAHINQLDKSKLSFRDDAFNIDNFGSAKTTMFLLSQKPGKLITQHQVCHYSMDVKDINCSKTPQLKSSVAANDDEIKQRLAEIASPLEMENFGLNFFNVKKPDGVTVKVGTQLTTKNVQIKPSNLFVYQETPGDDFALYPHVLYTQKSGGTTTRTGAEGMTRHKDFKSSSSSALKKFIGNFCDQAFSQECQNDSFKMAWTGAMTFATSKPSKPFKVAFAVTPTIQGKGYMNEAPLNGPFDTDSVWLTKSTPERKSGDKFKKGDKVIFRFNTSDRLHSVNKTDLSPNEIAAELKLVHKTNGEEVEFDKATTKWKLLDKDTWTYQVEVVMPKIKKKGTYKVEFTVRSLLKLGEEDKNTDDSLELEAKGKVGFDDRSRH